MEGDVPMLASPDPVAEAERLKAAEEMWEYYLDWSKTARTVIRRKDLRIKLGISSPTRSEETAPEEPEPPAAPAIAAQPGAPALGGDHEPQ